MGRLVGAKTIWLVKIFLVLTYPLSKPISMLLDVFAKDVADPRFG